MVLPCGPVVGPGRVALVAEIAQVLPLPVADDGRAPQPLVLREADAFAAGPGILLAQSNELGGMRRMQSRSVNIRRSFDQTRIAAKLEPHHDTGGDYNYVHYSENWEDAIDPGQCDVLSDSPAFQSMKFRVFCPEVLKSAQHNAWKWPI